MNKDQEKSKPGRPKKPAETLAQRRKEIKRKSYFKKKTFIGDILKNIDVTAETVITKIVPNPIQRKPPLGTISVMTNQGWRQLKCGATVNGIGGVVIRKQWEDLEDRQRA